MAEQFVNSAVTRLNGAIDADDTTLVVYNASAFPTTGDFRIRIDAEIMKVTGVSGNTFTVQRAVEEVGGVAVARPHAHKSLVAFRLTAGSLVATAGVPILVSRTVLNNAQILALPTEPVEVVADVGAGKVPVFLRAVLNLHTEAVYTNVTAGAFLVFRDGGANALSNFNPTAVSNGIGALSAIDALIGASPFTETGAGAFAGLTVDGIISLDFTDPLIRSFGLRVEDNDDDFEDGHANNTLTVDVMYAVIELP